MTELVLIVLFVGLGLRGRDRWQRQEPCGECDQYFNCWCDL